MPAKYQSREIETLADLARIMAAVERPVLLLEGTRDLPDHDAPMLRRMGALLARRFPSALFRSGNAPGSDTAFAEGVVSVSPERLELVLPRPPAHKLPLYEHARVVALGELSRLADSRTATWTVTATPQSKRLVAAHRGELPDPRLAAKAAYLIRDTLKVAGDPELGLAPATAGLFFVNEADPFSGGTGHTIRVCVQRHVPVVLQSVWQRWLL